MFNIRSLQEDQDSLLDESIYLLLGLASAITMVSFLGALFIIITYLKFPTLRSFAQTLVTYMSFSDFLFYFGKLLSIVEVTTTNPQTLCKFQGVLMNFGQSASILWSAVIAFSLYSTVLKQKHRFESQNASNFYYFAIGMPALSTFLLWALGYIGGNGETCWIIFDARHRVGGLGLKLGTFYFPLWIIIGFNAYVYIKLIRFLRTVNVKVSKTRISLYPLILIICWFFPTLHMIQTSFGYDSELMNALHNFSESLQGILNAIIYGMNTDVRREWKKFLHDKFGLFPSYQAVMDSNTQSEIPVSPVVQDKPEYDYNDFDDYVENDNRRKDSDDASNYDSRKDGRFLKRDSSWEIELGLYRAQKS